MLTGQPEPEARRERAASGRGLASRQELAGADFADLEDLAFSFLSTFAQIFSKILEEANFRSV